MEESLTRTAARTHWIAKRGFDPVVNLRKSYATALSPRPSSLSCPALKGSFRMQPVKCGNLFMSFAINCDDRVVRLRTLQQATGSRTLWMLNTRPNVFSNVRANRSCAQNILSSGNQPSFGTSTTQWMYKLEPAGSCSVYNMMAKSSTGAGKYLSVNGDCTGFEWRADPGVIGSKWNISESKFSAIVIGIRLPDAKSLCHRNLCISRFTLFSLAFLH
jgi:hypothetical protein